jgi:hypothetical protein
MRKGRREKRKEDEREGEGRGRGVKLRPVRDTDGRTGAEGGRTDAQRVGEKEKRRTGRTKESGRSQEGREGREGRKGKEAKYGRTEGGLRDRTVGGAFRLTKRLVSALVWSCLGQRTDVKTWGVGCGEL